MRAEYLPLIALCFGIAKNYPFNDGNRRTALLATRAFLYLNGREREPSQTDEVATIVAVADGVLNEENLAIWLERNARPHTNSSWQRGQDLDFEQR